MIIQHNGTALSVVAQHRHYFYDHDDDRHPRQAFLDDLHIELSKFQADGDLLIVCGDMNQDVLSPEIQTYFSSLSLCNLIFSRHDPSSAPATMSRNESHVSVDGVWASPNLDLIHGGYLPFDVFPGDHRPIWFEISYTQAFGQSLPKIWRPQARRLQLRDPRCVKRYNNLL